MKVLATLPCGGAILEVGQTELSLLVTGVTYPRQTLQVGATIELCQRVNGLGAFESRMEKAKAVGGVLRALADSIDASIEGAEKALTEPKPVEQKGEGQ